MRNIDKEFIKKAIEKNIVVFDEANKIAGKVTYKLLYLMAYFLEDKPNLILCEKCPIIEEEMYNSWHCEFVTMTEEEKDCLKSCGATYPKDKTCYLIMVGKNGKCVAGAC